MQPCLLSGPPPVSQVQALLSTELELGVARKLQGFTVHRPYIWSTLIIKCLSHSRSAVSIVPYHRNLSTHRVGQHSSK